MYVCMHACKSLCMYVYLDRSVCMYLCMFREPVFRTELNIRLIMYVCMYVVPVSVTVIPRGVDGGRATIGIGINKNIEKVNNIKASNPIQVRATILYIHTYIFITKIFSCRPYN